MVNTAHLNRDKKILVIGDVMLDKYLMGSASRLCPEAPVPVVNIEHVEWNLGGTANVASNIKAMGKDVILLGVVGNDIQGYKIREIAQSQKIPFIPIVDPSRITTEKKRIIAHGKLIVRIDRETTQEIPESTVEKIKKALEMLSDEVDSIVVSDYGKGLITEKVMKVLNSLFGQKGIPLYVDPKGKDYLKYRGAYLVKPNFAELEQFYQNPVRSLNALENAVKKIFICTNCKKCIVTWGKNGLFLFTNTDEWIHIPAVRKNDVVDVTGAGDVFLAALAVAESKGMDTLDACKLANKLAALSTAQLGTGPLPARKIEDMNGINFRGSEKNG